MTSIRGQRGVPTLVLQRATSAPTEVSQAKRPEAASGFDPISTIRRIVEKFTG